MGTYRSSFMRTLARWKRAWGLRGSIWEARPRMSRACLWVGGWVGGWKHRAFHFISFNRLVLLLPTHPPTHPPIYLQGFAVGVQDHTQVGMKHRGIFIDREGASKVVLSQLVLLLTEVDGAQTVPRVGGWVGGWVGELAIHRKGGEEGGGWNEVLDSLWVGGRTRRCSVCRRGGGRSGSKPGLFLGLRCRRTRGRRACRRRRRRDQLRLLFGRTV